MGWPFGEVRLAKHFEELEAALENWYGAINMRRMGIAPDGNPEKPEICQLLEQVEIFDTLPAEGGLLDQPHILIRELGLARRIKRMFENSFTKWASQQGTQS